MEHSMTSIGHHFTNWQRNPNNTDDLEEVVMGAEAFYAIAKELKHRSKNAL